MPLRRIALRLRDHDWLGVVIELAIVVLGVYLGLQASNWNQTRADKAQGREYLQHLQDDLRKEDALLTDTLAFYRQVSAYGELALSHAENHAPATGTAWSAVLAYYQASQIWPFRQPRTTFQEARTTGSLPLIVDAVVRQHIAEHYDESANSNALEILGDLPRYREHVRGLTPWAIQRYIWAHCYGGDVTRQTLVECPAPPDTSEEDLQSVLARMRQDAALTEELRFWMATQVASTMLLQQVQQQGRALAAEVEGTLAGR
ncbi:MAG: hypothetical protein KDI69_03340 [Xanthomonadales bacterium]|nr:hypothetical protein [Xanthomonadales bacterium]